MDKIYYNQHTGKFNHKKENEDDIEFIRSSLAVEIIGNSKSPLQAIMAIQHLGEK